MKIQPLYIILDKQVIILLEETEYMYVSRMLDGGPQFVLSKKQVIIPNQKIMKLLYK